MSWLGRLFKGIADRPLEAVETLLAFALFISGLWLLSPFYEAQSATVSRITGSHAVAMSLGGFQIFLVVPLVYALVNFGWPRRQFVRRVVTFIVFILYLFYTFSQMFVYGTHRIIWVNTLALALISGIAHLRLKWELD